MIGWQSSRHFLNQWELGQTKSNCAWSHAFSRAWRQLRVFSSSTNWLIVLFTSVVFGQRNYFGFGFTTLNWNRFTCWLIVDVLFVFFLGKSSPILSDHRISLQCQHDCMLLELDLQDIPKLKPTSLHLRQFSCRPHKVTNTRAIFRVPFQGCGTTRGTDSNHIVYQNVVGNSQEFNETRVVVRHVPELYYPFACRYRQKYTLTLKDGEMKEQTKESGHRKANSTKEGKTY